MTSFLSMVTSYGAQSSMTILQFWLLSMLTSDGTPVSVGADNVVVQFVYDIHWVS